MATNEIPIPNTTQEGQQLLAFRQQVINFLQTEDLLKFQAQSSSARSPRPATP